MGIQKQKGKIERYTSTYELNQLHHVWTDGFLAMLADTFWRELRGHYGGYKCLESSEQLRPLYFHRSFYRPQFFAAMHRINISSEFEYTKMMVDNQEVTRISGFDAPKGGLSHGEIRRQGDKVVFEWVYSNKRRLQKPIKTKWSLYYIEPLRSVVWSVVFQVVPR